MADVRKITVLNPAVSRRKMRPDEPPPNSPELAGKFRFEPSSIKLARRLDTIENKTVYLVDIGFGGGHSFMQEIQRWFAANMPSVTTVLRRKPGHVFMDNDNTLWEEVKEKGDAVILGVAG